MDYPEIVEVFSKDLTADPFGAAMTIFKEVLEFVLDDGISGTMNEHEFSILEKIATIVTNEGGQPVEPRIA